MNPPDFTLDKIKFATDGPTFEKAVVLYESGKVTNVDDNGFTYTAKVLSTQSYDVFVSHRHYNEGHCSCYLGQNDTLCKHMVALALYVVKNGQPLTEEDKKLIHTPACSGNVGKLSDKELVDIKKAIAIIKSGGVVATPTETAYGLIADPISPHPLKQNFFL